MKKLKDMSDCEITTIVKAVGNGVVLQVYEYSSSKWVCIRNCSLNPNLCYRLTPTKPSVNWDHIGPEINHICRTENGGWFMYEDDPTLAIDDWDPGRGRLYPFKPVLLASFKPGKCDWKDSKISRGDK